VVDDFEPWRDLLCSTLRQHPDLQIVGEAEDGLQAIQKAAELRPDLILLDIGLPSLNGIEVAHRISQLLPTAKMLFVSEQSDPEIVAAALNNGACGYILKTNAATELLRGIAAVLRGETFVSPQRRP